MSGISQGFMNFVQSAFRSFSDNFSSGFKKGWKVIKTGWSTTTGPATASTTGAISAVPMGGSNVTATVKDAGQGTGIAFWITDADNYWALASRETDSYYTTYYYYYCCPQAYSYTIHHSQTCTDSGSYTYTCYQSCNCTLITYYSCSTCCGYNYGSYFYCWSCNCTISGYGASCQQCPYSCTYSWWYQYDCSYDQQVSGTSYSLVQGSTLNTVQNFFLKLYQSISGTISEISSSTLGSQANSIKLITSGTNITGKAYSDGSLSNQTGSDLTYSSSGVKPNLYGIILEVSDQNQGNTISSFNANVN
jgi:hypothetical protein